MAEESLEPGASVSLVARRHGVNLNQLDTSSSPVTMLAGGFTHAKRRGGRRWFGRLGFATWMSTLGSC